ncbi:MAG TPA: ATP-binding protein [Actinomycetota bacterium]
MKVRGVRPVNVYVAVVCVGGLAALIGLALTRPPIDIEQMTLGAEEFWLFTVFVVIGELFPITVLRRREAEEITTSTTFAFALLLGYGTVPAMVSLSLASLLADLVHRKPVWKSLFNVAQYTLSMALAGAVYSVLGGAGGLSSEHMGPVIAAALTFFVANNVLTGVALGLAQGAPVARYLARDLLFQASTATALLALSPIVLISAERSLWLVPLLAAPVAAVYWGGTLSLENTRLVRRLEGALEHEKELSRLKDDFVAVVSHELRTPLTSIHGYLKTLLKLSGDLGEVQRRSFLEGAARQTDRLRGLIEQLLVVARLESHVEPITFSLVALQSLTQHVVEELRPLARGHTFDLRFHPTMDFIGTDEAKVRQILSNLIENALKYAPPDSRVTVRGITTGDGVLISVEDEGPGIPPESQERVFDRFYQVDSSATRSVGGTGLGLYICKRMSQTIGARLWLERSGRDGSVFCLCIPKAPPPEAVIVSGAKDAEQERTTPAQSITASV